MPALNTSDDVVLVVGAVVALLLGLAGLVERRRHRGALADLSFRVSVNGSRGKSTVTRLLAGALAEDGRRVLAKTTGTAPRVITWTGEEFAVHRRPEGANVGEQRRFVREARRRGADGVVVECMAVNPDYQVTFHDDYIQPDVLVVTGVLDDHLDVMGPTTRDVAEVFAATIPRGGVVAVAPGPHTDLFRAEAESRGATVLLADASAVDAELLRGFDHLVFPDNVALALAVTDHWGIPRERALRGMRAAPCDPYATRLLPVGDPSAPALFVNAFPANDPTSTLAVWQEVVDRGHPDEKLVVIMGCRDDRIARNQQFAEELLPRLPIDTLVVVGTGAHPVVNAAKRGDIVLRELRDETGCDPEDVVARLDDELHDRVVLAVGNLIGAGLGIVEAFRRRAVGGGPA